MRLTRPTRVHLTDQIQNMLVFTGSRGERFQITILDEDLIRVQGWPDGRPRLDRTWAVAGEDGDTPREGRARDDLLPFRLPLFHAEKTATGLRVLTQGMGFEISTGDFRIQWYDPKERFYAADLRLRAYEYDRAGQTVYHYMERRVGEHYYGFGERSGPLDKHGRRMRMVNLDSMGYDAENGDPLYKHWPFYITYLPDMNLAYGLFYDNPAPCVFDMGAEISAFYGYYRYYQADGGDIDYYMMLGPTIPDVVTKFSQLIGRPCLPPRWSLGYMGSTMSYTEAPDAGEQLKRFVDLCQRHRIPCDLFHLSSGYTTSPDGTRYVFTWNRDKIPDPKGLTKHFHDAGIRLAANIKPWLLTTHPQYKAVKAAGGFIQSAESDEPEVSAFWSGGAFTTADGSYIDFTSAAGYDWWKRGVIDSLLAYGIDAPWNDNNEFELWDDDARCAGFGRPLPVLLARSLQTLLMARASRQAQQEHRPDERPFVLSRSASPGVQRYAQTWSGDNTTSWKTLRWNIPMGLGLSLSGFPNTGHDVGGFFGPAPSPELFVRWVQNGIFHPRFTIHSFNTDGTVNEPWMHPEVLPIIRGLFEFRYRLIPYLYSLMVEASRSGTPVIRPLVYHFPHDPRTHTESFDFLLGSHLLVASVLEEGATTREVYLPAGTDWCDFHTGQWYVGGQTVIVDAPLERIPLFAAAGCIIPLGKVMQHTRAEPDDLRQLLIFPHPKGSSSSFTLYEDDGHTLAYQRGEFAELALKMEAKSRQVVVSASLRGGSFRLPYDRFDILMPPGDPRSVEMLWVL